MPFLGEGMILSLKLYVEWKSFYIYLCYTYLLQNHLLNWAPFFWEKNEFY